MGVDPSSLSKSAKGPRESVSKGPRTSVLTKGRDDSHEGFVGMKGIDETDSATNLMSSRTDPILSIYTCNLLTRYTIRIAKSLPKSDVTLTVTVKRAKNLKGSKGDKLNSFVRVQFADFDYKDVSRF